MNRITQGVACGLAAGALWGGVFMVPVWVPDFTPWQLSAGRYLAYGICSALLLAPRARTLLPQVRRHEWLALAWLSLLANVLYYVLLASAVQLGGVAMTTLVIGFMPVAVTVIGARRHRNVSLQRLIPSLLLGLAGVACTAWPALQAPQTATFAHPLIGLACALGALASWTTFAVSNSTWLKRLDHISARDWSLLLGLVTGAEALLLLIPALYEHTTHERSAWLGFAGACIGLSVFASVIGNAFWNRMSRLLPLTMTGQMILFETLFALLYCFLWERRWPHASEAAALVLLVASVLLCMSMHRTPAPSAKADTPDQASRPA